MNLSNFPSDVRDLLQHWAGGLDRRLRLRFVLLWLGILLAGGRRTVTSWLRVARVTNTFKRFYYLLGSLGHRIPFMASVFFWFIRKRLEKQGAPFLFAIDDTPTKRYGPQVQGAGIHHNPTPGPTNQKHLYGHVWVTLAWILDHPWWGTIALGLLTRLYIRERDLENLEKKPWQFRTKLELATDLISWIRQRLGQISTPLWIVADGFYAKKVVIQSCQDHQAVLFSRLRKDAALRTLPGKYSGRGRPRIYGKERIDLNDHCQRRQGWYQVEATQYGERKTKLIKTFLATWRPAGGEIRVVLVQERRGVLAFFCTETSMDPVTILEVMADRFSIEELFAQVKEVWGLGQQQLRNVHANVAATHCCFWGEALVTWWSWDQPEQELVDRRCSPWDDASRRPSPADRRRALRQYVQESQLRELGQAQGIKQEKMDAIIELVLQWVRCENRF